MEHHDPLGGTPEDAPLIERNVVTTVPDLLVRLKAAAKPTEVPDPASIKLAESAREQLPRLVAGLRPQLRMVLVGNSDSTGPQSTNRSVARLRAQAVATALRALGVDGARLSIEVAVAEHPLASNETDEGRRENRRVDVLVVGP